MGDTEKLSPSGQGTSQDVSALLEAVQLREDALQRELKKAQKKLEKTVARLKPTEEKLQQTEYRLLKVHRKQFLYMHSANAMSLDGKPLREFRIKHGNESLRTENKAARTIFQRTKGQVISRHDQNCGAAGKNRDEQ